MSVQLRSLLSAQSWATEGFVFQGLEHIKDHAEVSLDDLTILDMRSAVAVLKGTCMFHVSGPSTSLTLLMNRLHVIPPGQLCCSHMTGMLHSA